MSARSERNRADSLREMLDPLRPFLDNPKVTDIVINCPHRLFALSDTWDSHVIEISHQDLENLAVAAAAYARGDFDTSNPMLAAICPDMERLQVVGSPVCEIGTVLFAIRKPSSKIITFDQYDRDGFFYVDEKGPTIEDPLIGLFHDKNKRKFLEEAVRIGKNILVSGGTGSGKTTLIRTLASLIPKQRRIITIEDVPEIQITNPLGAQLFTNDHSATELLRVTFRLKPDGIILGEVRGPEAYDFIDIVQSGHGGSMTSIHASTYTSALRRLARAVCKSPYAAQQTYSEVMTDVLEVIDIVVQMTDQKRIGDIYYKNANP